MRKAKGITQIEFAKVFNIAKGTVGNWETGKREPDNETLLRIAEYFNVSVDYLLGREDKQKEPTVNINDGQLDDELVRLLCQLDDTQAQRARDFVRGLLASREDEASRHD